MTILSDSATLDEYEAEDVFDVVEKLEKSFGLAFDRNAFLHVNTFGDLCDVFDTHIHGKNHDDCTSQQAFYRIRKAISTSQQVSEQNIRPETLLSDIFPYKTRRKRINTFRKTIGINTSLLTYPGWLGALFAIGILASLIAFFFSWKLAVGGIVFFIPASWVAGKLGKVLKLRTVRDLTKQIARENYITIRRTPGTINRKEINCLIIDTFCNDLSLNKLLLNRDTRFSWAK